MVHPTTSTEVKKAQRDPYAHLLSKDKDKDTSIVKTWWFWTTLGVVAAGGVAAAVILATRQQTPSDKFRVDGFIQVN